MHENTMLPDLSKSPIGLRILVDSEYTDGNCYKAWCIAPIGQRMRHAHQAIAPSLLICREQNGMTWQAIKETNRTSRILETGWET